MKSDNKTKNELIEELESVRKKVKKLETLLKKLKHTEQDITERKLEEQEQTRRLATIVCDSNDAIIVCDFEGSISAWNRGAELMYGYSEKEALQMSLWHLTPSNKEAEQKDFNHRLLEGKNIHSFETQRLTKDGRLLDVWMTVTRLMDDTGKVIAIASTERDITERKRAEETLRYQATLLANVGDAIVASDADYRLTAWNMAAERLYGWKAEDVLGRNGLEIVRTEWPGVDADEMRRTIEDTGRWRGEATQAHKDGTRFPVEVISIVLHDEMGRITGYVSVNRDITERKQVEDKLRESEVRFRALIENSVDVISLVDANGLVLYNSPTYSRMMGYSIEERIGQNTFDLVHPDDRKNLQLLFTEIIQNPGRVSIPPIRVRHSDSSWRWIEGIANNLLTEPGVNAIVINFQDITERKQAEESLRQSEAKLTEAMKIAKLGTWEYDVASDQFTFNDQFYTLFHTTAEQEGGYIMSSAHYAQKFVYPDDMAMVGVEIQKALETDDPNYYSRVDHRIIRADGEMGYITVHIRIEKDAKGRTVKTHGVNQDITERKRAELEILKLNRTYAVLSNINKLIVREQDKQKLLNEVCKIAIQDGKFRMSGIGMIDKDTHSFKPVASASATSEYQENLHVTIAKTIALHEPLGIDILDGRNVICNDIEHDNRIAHSREQMLAYGYNSMAAFPLSVDDITIGVIHFYSNEFQFFNDEEVVLLEEIARDVSYALKSLGTEAQRKQAEEELLNERNLLRTVIDNLPDLIYVKDIACCKTISNLTDVHYLGAHQEKEVIGKSDFDFYPADIAKGFFADDQAVIQTGQPVIDREEFLLDKDRQKRWLLTSKLPLKDEKGQITGLVGIGRDITKQKIMQNQLLQTQKVQSIGTLAGGIAHDFNNILSIILAYASMLERSEGDRKQLSKSTTAITQAVGRGAALVRQILTFARQTGVVMKPMSIPELIRDLTGMLKETFPQVIEFQTNIEKNVPFINADYTQIHQVMLNLCINARDAMPNGGLISIEVKTIPLATLVQQFPEAKNDHYVSIDVSDTGVGMDAETKSRIFDPFFTTKEQGTGTGLGLSVVYGAIQDHHGFISVESTVGYGTTFSLYLPVPQKEEKIQETKGTQAGRLQRGSETILFVEDEDLLREVVQSALESNGYKVLIATNGREAVEMYKKHYKNVSLVLTDMGLPKLTGIDEFALLKAINPDVKVIFASGFISLEIRSELLKEGVKGFLSKPYDLAEVLQKIREVLDEKE